MACLKLISRLAVTLAMCVVASPSVSTARVIQIARLGRPNAKTVTLIDVLSRPAPMASTGELLHELSRPVGASANMPHVRRVWMEVTAYCPCAKCCGPHASGLTASGRDVGYNAGRFVAADTAQLPFGTRLIVPGYHDASPVEVIDRGGAIKGNKLDVFFPTHQQALDWGRRRMPVFVVE